VKVDICIFSLRVPFIFFLNLQFQGIGLCIPNIPLGSFYRTVCTTQLDLIWVDRWFEDTRKGLHLGHVLRLGFYHTCVSSGGEHPAVDRRGHAHKEPLRVMHVNVKTGQCAEVSVVPWSKSQLNSRCSVRQEDKLHLSVHIWIQGKTG